MAEKIKLKYGRTLLIGFGFMASMIAWTIYNAYVPLILKDNDAIRNLSYSGTVIGLIMVIDNVFGVIFQPLFGKLSDRTHTRFGKRTPYLLMGIPVCAVLFSLIPQMAAIWSLMLCIIVFNFIMSTWRAPVVALMPDMTPSAVRSEGNAMINLMGGVGTVLGTVAGKIFAVILHLNSAQGGAVRPYVFTFGSVIMVICLMVVVFLVREPDSRLTAGDSTQLAADFNAKAARKAEKQRFKEMQLSKAERNSLLFMLVALFFNTNATDSIQTYFTTFATGSLGMKEENAALFITLFAGATVLAAIPAGKVGHKYGRKKAIMGGLIGILTLFILYFLSRNDAVFSKYMLYIAIICGGASIAFVTINTLPLVLEIGGTEKIGTYTGYYYTATFSASIVGPVLCGRLFDLTKGGIHYWSLFIYCPICFALALLFITQVRHGEIKTIPEDILKEALMADD